jgi:hypothetical protein
LRKWFLKRNPKLQDLMEFCLKVLPDYIVQELFLTVDTKEKLHFQEYYILALEVAAKKVHQVILAFLPSQYEKESKFVQAAEWIFMESLRPELYKQCSLFLHR